VVSSQVNVIPVQPWLARSMHEAVVTAHAANAIPPTQRIRDGTTRRGNAIFRHDEAGARLGSPVGCAVDRGTGHALTHRPLCFDGPRAEWSGAHDNIPPRIER
jgi:hypothetical protein